MKKLLRRLASFTSFVRTDERALYSTSGSMLAGCKFLSVLLLEDDCADAARAVCELNTAGFKVSAHVVNTENAFRKQILVHTFDIVLADYRVKGWNALKALEILHRLKPEIPLIIVTGMSGIDIIDRCMQRGAADVVRKKDVHFLPIAVTEAIRERDPDFLNTSTPI